MAKIILKDLTPPAREMKNCEMKSIFGGIIISDGTWAKETTITESTTTFIDPGDTFIEPGEIFTDPLTF